MRMAWKAVAAGLVFAAFAVQAHEYKAGDLTIQDPWARPTAGPNMVGAAYMTLKNNGTEADTLKSVSSPDAERVQIHEDIHGADGIMRMRHVEGGLAIPPGGAVAFQPGGYHMMLIGLKHNLEEGQSFPLKLEFAHAGNVDVEVKVEKKAEAGGAMHMHH